MEIKKILDYKTPIMGVATLLILFAHFSFDQSYMTYIQQMGAFAVELFLILSGAGCYYSVQRRSKKDFFKRRFLRLYPFYIVLFIGYGIYICEFFHQPFWYYFLHGEAFISIVLYGEISNWFFAAITIFYILTPLMYKIIQKHYYYLVWIIIGVYILSGQLEFYTTGALYMFNNFIVVRFPAYAFGMVLGYLLQENPTAKIPTRFAVYGEVVCIILMIVNMIYNHLNYGLIMKIICGPYAFFSALWLSKLFEKIKHFSFFSFFGYISLESYLSYEKILSIFRWTFGLILGSSIITDISCVAITVVISVLLKVLYNILFKHHFSIY